MTKHHALENANPSTRFGKGELFAAAGAFVLLVAVGKTMAPRASTASTLGMIPATSVASPTTLPTSSPSIGTLHTTDLKLEFLADASGQTLYRVRDARGYVLADALTRSQLQDRFPSLDPARFDAQPALMLADPSDD